MTEFVTQQVLIDQLLKFLFPLSIQPLEKMTTAIFCHVTDIQDQNVG